MCIRDRWYTNLDVRFGFKVGYDFGRLINNMSDDMHFKGYLGFELPIDKWLSVPSVASLRHGLKVENKYLGLENMLYLGMSFGYDLWKKGKIGVRVNVSADFKILGLMSYLNSDKDLIVPEFVIPAKDTNNVIQSNFYYLMKIKAELDKKKGVKNTNRLKSIGEKWEIVSRMFDVKVIFDFVSKC